MTNLYILCGIPASGKSTWVAQHANLVKMSDGTSIDTWISRDTIRYNLLRAKYDNVSNLSSEQYFSEENNVYKRFIRRIQEAIWDETKSVFVDATNVSIASRNKLYKAIFAKPQIKSEDCYCTAVCFSISLNEAIERDKNRVGFAHVGEQAIKRFEHQLELPEKYSTKELFQFDELMIII